MYMKRLQEVQGVFTTGGVGGGGGGWKYSVIGNGSRDKGMFGRKEMVEKMDFVKMM